MIAEINIFSHITQERNFGEIYIPVKDPVSIDKRITFFKITLVRLIVDPESYRESYNHEKNGDLIALQEPGGRNLGNPHNRSCTRQ